MMKHNNKPILVTGGSGLVGSQFTENAIRLVSSDYDLRDPHQVNKCFERYADQISGVVHCAARVGGVQDNISYKGEFFYDNIMMNANIIEAARKYGIQNLVCLLSTCIFPDKVDFPIEESKIHLGPPHESNYPYAYAKRMVDIQIRAYRDQYGLNYKSVIPTNIYGPNDLFDIEYGHVLPALIHKCYLARENNKDFVVWGDGSVLREFIFAEDVAKLARWVLENYNDTDPIILSTSDEISLKDVVGIIIEKMNFKGNVVWDKTKPMGQYRKPSSIAKLKHYLPNFEFTPIEEGLTKTIRWFEDNYTTVRRSRSNYTPKGEKVHA